MCISCNSKADFATAFDVASENEPFDEFFSSECKMTCQLVMINDIPILSWANHMVRMIWTISDSRDMCIWQKLLNNIIYNKNETEIDQEMNLCE